jgi:rare lipoprotein A
MMLRIFFVITSLLLFASCATRDGLPRNYHSFDASDISNAVPKVEPKSRYGNPSSYVVLGKRYTVLKSAHCYHAKGIASWYGTMFHERLTSSREPYDMYKMTAANKVLPLPTYVRVHNLENNRTIIVKVNDRGPFHDNRIIDLSFAAAKKIGMLAKGTALVEVEAIDPQHPNASCNATATETTSDRPQKAHKPQLYLQLGAFGTKASATHLANRLSKFSQHAIYVYESKQHDKTLYKVQIGPLKDVSEVDTLTAKFKKLGFGVAYAAIR